MKKITVTFLLILGVILNSCSYDNNSKSLNKWVGNYIYEEQPIKANAGYYMTMTWTLSIIKKNETGQGILEVNGQQTYIKLLTDVSIYKNSISIIYNSRIEGSDESLKKGDTLLILSVPSEKLETNWKALKPRLIETSPKDCFCFALKTKSSK